MGRRGTECVPSALTASSHPDPLHPEGPHLLSLSPVLSYAMLCYAMYDITVCIMLDLLEIGVESYRPVSDFKTDLISVSSHPIVLFMGPQFEAELSKVKNLFLDLFRGPATSSRLAVSSIEHVILFAANDVTHVHMRVYRVAREGRNVSGIQEMGPRIGMKIRRHNPPDEKVFRKSLKIATVGQIRHARNVSYNREGSQLGRVHMERQDYSQLQTRKRKALKVSSGKKAQRMDTD